MSTTFDEVTASGDVLELDYHEAPDIIVEVIARKRRHVLYMSNEAHDVLCEALEVPTRHIIAELPGADDLDLAAYGMRVLDLSAYR